MCLALDLGGEIELINCCVSLVAGRLGPSLALLFFRPFASSRAHSVGGEPWNVGPHSFQTMAGADKTTTATNDDDNIKGRGAVIGQGMVSQHTLGLGRMEARPS